MSVERTDSSKFVVMRQRLDNSVSPTYEPKQEAQKAEIASSTVVSQFFADVNFSKFVACIHPVSRPLPLICRVPKNIEFLFVGPYGALHPFKSATGAIYVSVFVDHLVSDDLSFFD